MSAAVLLLFYTLMQMFVLASENYLRYALWIPLQWIFTYSWYPAFFRGIVKRKENYWVSTAHVRNISITEVHEDILLVDARKRLEGLDNLHRLPLGQILLKATVITGRQLKTALEMQKKNGGLISQQQLNLALALQAAEGIMIGEALVRLEFISSDTLHAILEVQQLFFCIVYTIPHTIMSARKQAIRFAAVLPSLKDIAVWLAIVAGLYAVAFFIDFDIGLSLVTSPIALGCWVLAVLNLIFMTLTGRRKLRHDYFHDIYLKFITDPQKLKYDNYIDNVGAFTYD